MRKLTPKKKGTVIRVYGSYLNLSRRRKSIAYFFQGDKPVRYKNEYSGIHERLHKLHT